METKGIEEMTREELIELVASINKELEETKKSLEFNREWEREARGAKELAEKKLSVIKAFLEVV